MREMTEHEKADRVLTAAYFLEAGVQADDPERKVLMEYLDGENFIVNVDVICGRGCCPKDDAWLSELIASELADAMVQALNAFNPVDGMEWHCHSEPNYWDEDGNGCSPEDRDCQTVQYHIYTTESEGNEMEYCVFCPYRHECNGEDCPYGLFKTNEVK